MQENTESFFNKLKNYVDILDKTFVEKSLLILLFFITIVFRLFHISSATIIKDKLLFFQPDAYYHIRRTLLFAHNFPSLNSFDYYLSYPVGAECPWPPLYDWVISLISLILGLGKVDTYTVELLHAIFPILTAALAVFPIYYIAKIIWKSKAVGFLAAFFWTFAPNALSYSVFISGDHHSAEIFFAICFFYYGVKTVEALIEGRPNKKSAYLTGLFAALGLLVWHIQIFYFSLWLLFAYIVVIIKRTNISFVKEMLLTNIKIFAIPIIAVSIVRILSPIVTEQSILRFDFFSFFQPLYILLLLFPIIYYYIYLSLHSKKTFLIFSFIILIFIVGVTFMFTPVVSAIMEMKVFITKSEPYLTNIQEYNPLLRKGHFMWGGLISIINYFKFLYYAMPAILSIFYLVKFLIRRQLKDRDVILLPILILMFTTGILQFYQKRWGNESNFGVTLAHGIVIYSLWEWGKRFKLKSVLSPALTLIYTMSIIFPIALDAAELMYKKIVPVGPDLYYTLNWINENTPKTSYYLTPTKKPEYAIMTPWDIGHLTIYYGERPVCASNFGHSLRGSGFKDSNAIWQVREDVELAKICERNQAKFLIISDPIGYMTGLENLKFFYPFPAMRLMQYDGSFSPFGAALENFRLVYESYSRNENTYNLNDVRLYKVYEFVKGARITGKTYPLHEIKFSTTFRSDKGREFNWSLKAFSDEKGNFSCVIPYATANVKYAVRAMKPFKAISKNKEVVFDINEDDVQLGKEIKLNFAK